MNTSQLDASREDWVFITLVDGNNLIGRVSSADSIGRDDWIKLEEVCTYHVQMAQVQGGAQALFAMCIPYAASPDPSISINIKSSNIASYSMIEDMPQKTRAMIMSKVRESKSTANRLAAANAGILTR